MAAKRKYPVGIQSFESIRSEGYIYVDKTEIIYKMITEGKPYFLSRPRRFGKSLLVNTLAAVFEGRRDLFEAFTTKQGIEQPQLYIATTDWEWEKHPVLRFDFSRSNLVTIADLDELIDNTLKGYEHQYSLLGQDGGYSLRMTNIIHAAERQTGRKVVVLVDEYDNMMLHSLGQPEMQKQSRERFQSLFAPLKSEDEHLQFVFITGISKFSQMGIFSRLNQLMNISMTADYEALCGITEEELVTTLRPDIEQMAARNGLDYDAMLGKLKANYDGYHFSKAKADIYNPFSLFNAIASGDVGSYWFESGTTSALIDMLAQMPRLDISDVEGVECISGDFDRPFDSYQAPLPVLYQSGYLTIRNYDRELDTYTLGFPNLEVRKGFAQCLYQYVVHRQDQDDRPRSTLQIAYMRFRRDNTLEPFVKALQTFFAGVSPTPSPSRVGEGSIYKSEQKTADELTTPLPTAGGDGGGATILYTLFVSFGADVVAEDLSAKGRADLTLKMPRGIYIIELKYDHPADEALKQIDERGYARKYVMDGRPVTKVGLSFSREERNITEWKSREETATTD